MNNDIGTSPGNDKGNELRTFGGYTIVSELGRGGMGVVYEAIERDMDRRVALKVLPAGLMINEKSVTRFRREARIIGQLNHPSVVQVFTTGVEGDTPYIAMELVEGESLAKMLAQKQVGSDEDTRGLTSRVLTGIARAFAPDEPTQVFPTLADEPKPEIEADEADVGFPRISTSTAEMDLTYCIRMASAFATAADGLHHAHSKGVVHRDLKPSNLILDPQGSLRILDFGLARLEGQESLTRTGEVVGTPRYMSPEQVGLQGAPVDQRTDVYSLGATLYESLTLRPPLQGRTAQETLNRILHREPRPLRQLNSRVPLDLETIVLKCLRKNPAERYGTAEALAQDLRRFKRGDPIEARPASLAEKMARRLWQHRGKVAVAAAAVVLLSALAWLVYDRAAESHRRKVAEYDQDVVNAVVKLQASGAFVEHAHGLMSDNLDFGVELLVGDLGWGEDALIVAARQMLQRSCAAVPDRPEAYYHLARALILSGDEDQALHELSGAVDRDYVPAMVLKASIHQRRAEVDAAKTLRDRARKSGQDTWARSWIAAQLALAERRWADAATEYARLIELAKTEPSPYLGSPVEIYLGCGIARLRLKQYAAARQSFVVASALCPGAVEPELLLGYTHLAEGNDQDAEEAFERLYARHPDDDVIEGIAGFYVVNFMRFEKGLYWAQRIKRGYFRELWSAICLRWLGRTDEALAAANELVKIKPDVALSYFIAASASEGLNKLEDAERFAWKARELAPNSAMPYVILGGIFRARGKQEQSIAMLQKAVEVEPNAPMSNFQLGVAYYNLGQLEQAAQSMKTAVAARPDATGGIFGSGAPHLLLGDILQQLGKPEESLEMFGQAVTRARDFEWTGDLVDLFPLLARAQVATGRTGEAIQTLEWTLADPRTDTGSIPQLEQQLAEISQNVLPDLPTYRCIELALRALQNEPTSEDHADKLLREFRDVAKGPDAAARTTYLQGRILQLKDQHQAAAEHLSVAVGRDPANPAPLFAWVQSLRATEQSDEAYQQLRDRLAKDCPRNTQLWNAWLAICWVDLEQSVQQVLAEIPCQSHDGSSPARFVHNDNGQASARYLDDLHWLLNRLLDDEPIRINCGGDKYLLSPGAVWGHDRFYTRGRRFMEGQEAFQEEIENTEDDPLYQTERVFSPSAYTPAGYLIPLPPGKYRVDLHFAEIWHRDTKRRAFDAVLEGERVLAQFDPGQAGFAVAQTKRFNVSVDDGLLEIMFEVLVEHPKVSAIEVQQIGAP